MVLAKPCWANAVYSEKFPEAVANTVASFLAEVKTGTCTPLSHIWSANIELIGIFTSKKQKRPEHFSWVAEIEVSNHIEYLRCQTYGGSILFFFAQS